MLLTKRGPPLTSVQVTRVAVLGGGPAGVGAAWRLQRSGDAQAVVIERGDSVGGNAGSFTHDGHILDYGSHRLHRACDPAILDDIRSFLGEDLLDRPRHGRIRLLGQWVHFPLKPADLLLNLDKSFALGTAGDMLRRVLPGGRPQNGETFASVLEDKLGSTICKHFYFPYARKIWGHGAETLSAIQAHKRVSANSFGKLLGKVLRQLPGLKTSGTGNFFYPRGGFGQISDAYAQAAREEGAELMLGWTITGVHRPEGDGGAWRVVAERNGEKREVEADHVWSTLPITRLAQMLRPEPPSEVLAQAERIGYRAMILIYLDLEVPSFTEYDAHYFPGEDVAITRLSETKNYAARSEPIDRTAICAELPCQVGDDHWQSSDEELGELLARDLEQAGLPLPVRPRSVFTRRLPQAYPIYQREYEKALDPLEDWVGSIPRLLTYGRQGLFAHDNTHHALAMAYAATDCLRGGVFDEERWAAHREVFATHVVED